jgi:6-phosphogluconolactonase (cycloisomerase 2 family)
MGVVTRRAPPCGRPGPRAGGRWLVAAELSAEVLVYDADWAPLGRVPATRHDGYCLVSELVATDRFLYVGNRGADTVSVFTLGGELPAYVTEVPTGAGPRHIALGGDLLHVANELSDELITMRVDPVSGVPEQVAVLSVPSPTCVLR